MKKIFNTKVLAVLTALLMVLTAVLPMGTSAAAMTDEEIREHLGLLLGLINDNARDIGNLSDSVDSVTAVVSELLSTTEALKTAVATAQSAAEAAQCTANNAVTMAQDV